jgi:hypothetical protein
MTSKRCRRPRSVCPRRRPLVPKSCWRYPTPYGRKSCTSGKGWVLGYLGREPTSWLLDEVQGKGGAAGKGGKGGGAKGSK